jgi:hypothetical protein
LANIANGGQGDEKMTILCVDHHSGYEVGPIVFILGQNIAKYKDMPYGRSADIASSKWPPFFKCNITYLPLFHHGNHRISTTCIIFILSEHVAKYEYMPYG